jgi:hypothetical protein
MLSRTVEVTDPRVRSSNSAILFPFAPEGAQPCTVSRARRNRMALGRCMGGFPSTSSPLALFLLYAEAPWYGLREG